MVSRSKPCGEGQPKNNEFKELKPAIDEVINNCKSIINRNYNLFKEKKQAELRKKYGKSNSKLTLETVAQDMSNLIESLKTHLRSNKLKTSTLPGLRPNNLVAAKVYQRVKNNINQDKVNNRKKETAKSKPDLKPGNLNPANKSATRKPVMKSKAKLVKDLAMSNTSKLNSVANKTNQKVTFRNN